MVLHVLDLHCVNLYSVFWLCHFNRKPTVECTVHLSVDSLFVLWIWPLLYLGNKGPRTQTFGLIVPSASYLLGARLLQQHPHAVRVSLVVGDELCQRGKRDFIWDKVCTNGRALDPEVVHFPLASGCKSQGRQTRITYYCTVCLKRGGKELHELLSMNMITWQSMSMAICATKQNNWRCGHSVMYAHYWWS